MIFRVAPHHDAEQVDQPAEGHVVDTDIWVEVEMEAHNDLGPQFSYWLAAAAGHAYHQGYVRQGS